LQETGQPKAPLFAHFDTKMNAFRDSGRAWGGPLTLGRSRFDRAEGGRLGGSGGPPDLTEK